MNENCDCDRLDCLICFELRHEAAFKEMGIYPDRKDFYEWLDIKGLLSVEEIQDEYPIPDEIYDLKDSW